MTDRQTENQRLGNCWPDGCRILQGEIADILKKTRTIKDYHGLSWTLLRTIMDYHGLSWSSMFKITTMDWTIIDYHRLSWTIMDCNGLS